MESAVEMSNDSDSQNMSVSAVTSLTLPYPHPTQMAVMWILPFLILPLNVMVFVVSPRMKTQQPYISYGMISLAMADFGIGLINLIRISYNTHINFKTDPKHPICLLDAFGQAILTAISIGTLTIMNFDRFLTMALPFKYPHFLTNCRVKAVFGTIWILGLVYLIPTLTGLTGTHVKYYEHAFMCVPSWKDGVVFNSVVIAIIFGIPLIFNSLSFIGIFYLSRKKPDIVGGGRTNRTGVDDVKNNLRIFRTLAVMTFGVLFVSALYFATVALPEVITGKTLHPISDFVTTWIGIFNTFWNPLVYVFTFRPFYCALIKLYKGSVLEQMTNNITCNCRCT